MFCREAMLVFLEGNSVNFDRLVRTTDLDGVALQKHEHCFPAEHSPVSDCI
jgi:hypothetical protein